MGEQEIAVLKKRVAHHRYDLKSLSLLKKYRKKDVNKRGRISPCVYGENGEAVDENDDSCGDSGLLEGAPSRLLDVLQRLLLNVVHRDECNLVVGALQ